MKYSKTSRAGVSCTSAILRYNTLWKSILLAISIFPAYTLYAQTPDDAIMMKAGDACLLVNYADGQFNQYWEGARLRQNQTIATFSRNTVMPMAAIGVIPRLNFYVGAPYVMTKSSEPYGSRMAGVSAFQDLVLAAKYRFVDKSISQGRVTVLGTVGFSTPMTNYLADYMYAIGFGAPEWSYRGIAQYQSKHGQYVRLSGAYLWRGYTQAERDYYYNNGSYYTSWMDVPSAYTMGAAVGSWFFNTTLRVEANLNILKSMSGDDIRAYNAPQPTNKVESTNVGFLLQYQPKYLKGFGALIGHSRVLDGRNTGKMNTSSVGLIYQFTYLKKKN
jgi:hypothetical protein